MKWFKRQEPDAVPPTFINNPKILLVSTDLKTYLGAYEAVTSNNFTQFEKDTIFSYNVTYDYSTKNYITISRAIGSLPLLANEVQGMTNILRLAQGRFSLVLVRYKNIKKLLENKEDSLCVLGYCFLKKFLFTDTTETLEIQVERILPFITVDTLFKEKD